MISYTRSPQQVFCGGLPPETTEEEIRTYFGQFGNIEALELPMDKEKNVRRGFIFVTYETVAAADAAVKKPKQTINGKECDVKKATPKNDGKLILQSVPTSYLNWYMYISSIYTCTVS